MLNIQIRGMKSDIHIGSINELEIDQMLKKVAEEKISIAELMLQSSFKKKWNYYNDLYSFKKPCLTKDTEIIITAYDDKDYYSEGYSFYRDKISNLIQTPTIKDYHIQRDEFFIINFASYYGSIFETELNELSYEFFNPDLLSISSIKIPYPNQILVDELFLNNLPLIDLNRSKVQLVRFNTLILQNNLLNKTSMLEEKDFKSLKFIINSEKIF